MDGKLRIKGERSDKVGRTYEQCAECSRGDCDKRADICVIRVRSENAPHF